MSDSLLPCQPASVAGPAPAVRVVIPSYLERVYWWAYVHPRAVRVFERDWLVNMILFGNYVPLCDAVLGEFAPQLAGATLQVACVYGDLTPRLVAQLAPQARLDVVDVLPIQLENLRAKLADDSRVHLVQRDSSALGFADASYEQVLAFFLLHEQPEAVRRGTLAEAYRVCKPGGRIVIVDYHGPRRWNLLRAPLRGLLKLLEPFADDLWQHEVQSFFPDEARFASVDKRTYFGGLYQKLVFVKA